jgi:hypothetical protein
MSARRVDGARRAGCSPAGVDLAAGRFDRGRGDLGVGPMRIGLCSGTRVGRSPFVAPGFRMTWRSFDRLGARSTNNPATSAPPALRALVLIVTPDRRARASPTHAEMLRLLHRKHHRQPLQPGISRATITGLLVHPVDLALLAGGEGAWMDQDAPPGRLKQGLPGTLREAGCCRSSIPSGLPHACC